MSIQTECPRCGRPAGQRCRTRSGMPLTVPHVERSRLAAPLSPAALRAAEEAYASAVDGGHTAALAAAVRAAVTHG